MYLVKCFNEGYESFQTPTAFMRFDDAKLYAYDCSRRYLDLNDIVAIFDKDENPLGYYTYNGIWEEL